MTKQERTQFLNSCLLGMTSAFFSLAFYLAVQALGELKELRTLTYDHETRITVLEKLE